MSWLERLKNLERPGTKPRKPGEMAFLGLQGCPPEGAPTFRVTQPPACDDPHKVAVMEPLGLDRHCWPHSIAMNTAEIERFLRRTAQFTNRGLTPSEAESLAEKLVFRDRDGDDRRVCLECSHLRGLVRWQCGNSSRAGLGRDLPSEVVVTLQRCEGLETYLCPN